jgi:hypothetical protein
MAKFEIKHEDEQSALPPDTSENELTTDDLEEAAGGKIPCFPDVLPMPEDPFAPIGPEM